MLKRTIIIVALAATLLWAGTTLVGTYTVTGQWDASGATHTLPIKKGVAASKPATCSVGEEYFATDSTAGQNEWYCTATNTWTQQTGSGGSTTGYIDLPAGGLSSGALSGVWNDNRSGYGSGAGANITAIKFVSTGDVSRANFRLPPNWTGTSVTARITTIDIDGTSGGISYDLQLGCWASGDSAITDPTFGTALTLSGTQGANTTLNLSGSLNITAKCVANAFARVLLTRNSSARTGNHGITDVSLTW